jgi:hypothetical protein
MVIQKLNLCRRCANTFFKDSRSILPFPSRSLSRPPPLFPSNRTFFSKRLLSGQNRIRRLSAPDPNGPTSSITYPIQRDPGVTLGEHGIPVPPSETRKTDYTEEKSWAETVYRTLSGGMKSDYLKCTLLPDGLISGTELDEHGNVRVGMQAFKKVELCTMVYRLLVG